MFKRVLSSPWPYHVIRVIIGVMFVWAGALKIDDPIAFAVVIEEFGLVPASWALPLAYVMPALEVVCGAGLLLEIPGSLAGIGGFLAFFIGVLWYGMSKGLDIDCGCFGPGDLEAELLHSMGAALVRDLVMVAGILYMVCWRRYLGDAGQGH